MPRDEFGRPELTDINWETRELILSPECHGRTAVNAALGLYLAACQREEGPDEYPYTDLTQITSRLERFLLDTDASNVLIERIRPAPRSSIATHHHVMIAAGAVVAVVVVVAVAWVAVHHLSSPPIPQAQLAATNDLPDPTATLALTRVPLVDGNLVVAHPTAPEFITATAEGVISRHTANNARQEIGRTLSPALSLYFDANRQEVVVTDWLQNLDFIPIDLLQPTRTVALPARSNRVFPLAEGSYLWADYHSNIYRLTPETSSNHQPIDGVRLALPASSTRNAHALLSDNDITVEFATHQRPLQRRLATNQHLNAFDTSDDLRVCVMAFDDGTIETYRRNVDGYTYEILRLPNNDRASLIAMTRDGSYAYAVGRDVYHIDLTANRIIGRIPTRDLIQKQIRAVAIQDQGRRLLLATRTEGFIWQP